MAEKNHEYEPTVTTEGAVESKDRGMLDFLGKKKEEEKPQHHQDQEVITNEFEKVHVTKPKIEEEHKENQKEKKPGVFEKLHRSNSSSSSSSDEEDIPLSTRPFLFIKKKSDEEEGDDEEKKKKEEEKKGLKEKLKEKISGEKEEGKHETVTVENPEEKILEKQPGQHKNNLGDPQVPSPHHVEHVTAEAHNSDEGESKEKKSILEKLKEKLPGYHHKIEEEKENVAH